MKLEKVKEIHRLGIFFFYDKEGIVDDYVIYMLEHMNKHMSETIVVCNGKLTQKGRERFEKLENTKVIVRENKGFDVWAYKTALEYYGWEHIEKFDEVIMYNFTIMGPVYDLDDMFNDMDGRNVDFWGLTIHNGAPFDPWEVMDEGYIPIHIQSHFIAVRKRMLQSFEFQNYWENRPMIKRYEEAVGLHEAIFTKKFEECGYKWDVYVDTKDLIKKTFYPMFNMPIELIEKRKCPFFKRKIFINEVSSNVEENANFVAGDLYNYLKNSTNYDTEMIIKHLLRSANQCDLISATNLQYVLPSSVEQKSIKSNDDLKIAFFINLIDIDKLEDNKTYLTSIPKNSDIYIAIKSETDKKIFDTIINFDYKYIIVDDKKKQKSNNILLQLFKGCIKKYDLVCVINTINQVDILPLTNISSFSYITYESILKNEIYVNNLIKLFIENPSLGMLVPPTPVHSKYFSIVGQEWNKSYEHVNGLLEELDINLSCLYEKQPVIPLGNCYWVRPEAMAPILNEKVLEDYSDENIKTLDNIAGTLECALSLIAQSRGYYSTWVYPDTLAQNYLTNMNQYLARINRGIKNKNCTFHEFESNLVENKYFAKEYIKCEIHFDTGNGFNMDEMEEILLVRNYMDSESVEIEFDIPKGTKFVRFDPCESLMCICNGIEAENNDVEIFCYNGIRLGENDIFLTKDPQYVIKGDFEKIKTLNIKIKSLSVFYGEDSLSEEFNKLFYEQKDVTIKSVLSIVSKKLCFLKKIFR